MTRGACFRLAAAAFALASLLAHAGGPLQVCSAGTPVKYAGAGAVSLNYDGGGALGSFTKAQADAIVTAASALWTNLGTATFAFSRGPDLPVDVTSANYTMYFGNFSDAKNPVIYDSDGSIIDLVLGTGASSSVLGFAGSAWSGCNYAEGQAVINGRIAVSSTTMTTVLAHELGHLIGLDHTQIDAAQGLDPSGANFPLMYPIAYRATATLADDDIAAVSALYPAPTLATFYGTLQGNFRLADGVTPVRGANIWAEENTTGKVFSVVSDYLKQGTGFFKMLLPPGVYTLHAEAVDTRFNGGSSVGPYSANSSDASFQSPMYTGTTPMAPLTFGNSAPIQITITAACTATADFRFNGAGSVSGNCVTTPPPPAPPPTGNARLANISTRLQVLTGNNVMIGGLVIGGSANKTVAITATGPSLAAYGITNPLANPTLTLVRQSDNAIIATNDDWQTDPNAALLQASGFAPTDPREAGLYVNLPPGAYTAIVSGANGGTGVGLVGVFEVDHPEVPLVNIAARGFVQTGNNVMIGGFIVQGTTSQRLAITATGPSLAAYGVTNPLANPTLTIVRSSDGAVVATNDNWQSDPNAAQLQASGFAPSDPFESGLLLTLPPGAYTAIVSGVGGTTGTSVVGIFAVP